MRPDTAPTTAYRFCFGTKGRYFNGKREMFLFQNHVKGPDLVTLGGFAVHAGVAQV